jgi:hypothetical protein
VRRVAAAEAPLDERGALSSDRALWRFQPGHLMPGPRLTGQEARPAEADRDIADPSDAICPVGGIMWGEVWRMGCGVDSGTPWRGEKRSNKTRQRQGRVVWIMAPWPAVG